ncbi:MAG: DUF2461 domain-containing protein [Bacteroidales bacterium]|nr:DUF2461 domain-containing protein [Bacteroidales bacterium]
MENQIFEFLKELTLNNRKEWFDTHKTRYLLAKENMESMVEDAIWQISEFDNTIADQQVKKCLFRIYRDVRFSKNKTPYKTNMGAVIVPGGKKTGKAGYYIHIEPGGSFLGGGVYLPEAKILKSVREEVLYEIDEFRSVIEKPRFVKLFGSIHGEKLKRPPKGFPADFKDVELLKLKSFALFHPISDEQVLRDDFIEYATAVFKEMRPFNNFINRTF